MKRRSDYARYFELLGDPLAEQFGRPPASKRGKPAGAEAKARFCAALLLGESVSRAAAAAGVHRATAHRWLRADPEVRGVLDTFGRQLAAVFCQAGADR